MLSVCRLFGNFKIAFWGLPLFLWLCFFCFAPCAAQAEGQAKQNTTAGQTLQHIAGKLRAVKLAPPTAAPAEQLKQPKQAGEPQADQPMANPAVSYNSSSLAEVSNLPRNSGQSGQVHMPDRADRAASSHRADMSNSFNPADKTQQAQTVQAPTQSEALSATPSAAPSPEQLTAQAAEQVEFPEPQWEVLEDGLENTQVSVFPVQNATQTVSVDVLRIEPEKWDFELLTASEFGRSKSLGQWAKEHELVAAINASMYLPDGKTSTGYMRRGEHINNGRIVTNFGVFFVAMPENNELPQAAVLDRNDDSWHDELEQYQIVVQNYRLMTPLGKPLWGPALLNSLAAIGQDKFGRILFLHCGQPISAISFVEGLTRMPLDLVRLMYVEGGHQAAMLVHTKAKSQVWTGKYAALMDSNAMPPLPNVIGVKHKSEKVKPEKPKADKLNTNATIK